MFSCLRWPTWQENQRKQSTGRKSQLLMQRHSAVSFPQFLVDQLVITYGLLRANVVICSSTLYGHSCWFPILCCSGFSRLWAYRFYWTPMLSAQKNDFSCIIKKDLSRERTSITSQSAPYIIQRRHRLQKRFWAVRFLHDIAYACATWPGFLCRKTTLVIIYNHLTFCLHSA